MSLKVNFDLAVKMDLEITILRENGKLETAELDMSARLIKASEGAGYFTGDEETKIRDVLVEHVKEPPQILNDNDKPYTMDELLDIPFVRNAMYARLIEVSFNPEAARGNSKPQ